MKIINEGKVPDPKPVWWHHRLVTCNHCLTKFELEPGDKIKIGAVRMIGGKQWAVFNCPKCNTEITIHSDKT